MFKIDVKKLGKFFKRKKGKNVLKEKKRLKA